MEISKEKIDYLTLNNSIKMPILGLGTYSINGIKLMFLLTVAAILGYRSFDTATAYHNERWLGKGLRLCGVKRSKLFITSKLCNGDQRSGNIRNALKKNLRNLGLDYLDLYLMHWPYPGFYIENWKHMEDLYKEGLVRAIGVCNFHEHHLQNILDKAEIIPAVNQIELHPLLTQKPLVEYCINKKIQIAAYSPLARMDRKLIGNKAISEIANNHNASIPQIVLRWCYQHRFITIPKSSNYFRLKQNISINKFSLNENEMSTIDCQNQNYRVRHNPDDCDFEKL